MAFRNPIAAYIANNLTGLTQAPSSLIAADQARQAQIAQQQAAQEQANRQRLQQRAAAHAAAAALVQQAQQQQAPDPIAQAQERLVTRQHIINDANSQGMVTPVANPMTPVAPSTLPQQQTPSVITSQPTATTTAGPPALVVETMPEYAARWDQFSPQQQQGVLAQAQVIADQRAASQAVNTAATTPDTGSDPLASAINAVSGEAQQYGRGIVEATKQAGTQAISSALTYGVDPSVSTFQQQMTPVVASGVGVLGAATNLPGVNYLYDKNVEQVGDLAYDRVTRGERATDLREYNPTQYADMGWQEWQGKAENRETIITAHDQGIDTDGDGTVDLSGGAAVYASYLASLPQDEGLWKGGNSLVSTLMRAAGLDPLTYASMGAGASRGIAKDLLAKAARLGGVEKLSTSERIALYAARGGHTILNIPDAVTDVPIRAISGGLGWGARGIDKATGGRLSAAAVKATELTPENKLGESMATAEDTYTALMNAQRSQLDAVPTTARDEAADIQEGATLPVRAADAVTVQTPTSAGVVSQPIATAAGQTPPVRPAGTGEYVRVTVKTGKKPEFLILDPDGMAIERITPQGRFALDGTLIEAYTPGTFSGSRSLSRRDELNKILADEQSAGLNLPGTARETPVVETTPVQPAVTPTANALQQAAAANPAVPAQDFVAGHWLDPATGRATPASGRETSLYEHVVTELAPVMPVEVAKFQSVYNSDPRVAEFTRKMQEFDDSPTKRAAQEAGLPLRESDPPEQTLLAIQHTVDVQKPIYRETIGGEPPRWNYSHAKALNTDVPPPTRPKSGKGWVFSNVNESAALEFSVFGNDLEAKRSRQYFHSRQAHFAHLAESSTSQAQKAAYLRQANRYATFLDETARLRHKEIEAGGLARNPVTGAPMTVPGDELTVPQAAAPETPPVDVALARAAETPKAEPVDLQRPVDVSQETPTAAAVPGEATIPVAEITTQKAMQPRKALNAAKAERLGREWQPSKYQRITVWQDPATSEYVVLAGHHRLEGARQAGVADLPVNVFEGDRTAAIAYARRSNSQADALSPSESGRAINDEIANGKSFAAAVAEYPSIKTGDARRYVELTHLPEDLQDLVDNGQLSVAQGAALGKAVREGTFSPAEVQVFARNKVLAGDGYSDAKLTGVLTILKQMKEKAGPQLNQGGLFGDMDLGTQVVESADSLYDKRKQLAGDERAFTRVSGITGLSPEQTSRVGAIRAEITALEQELGLSAKKVRKPRGATGIVDENFTLFDRLMAQASGRADAAPAAEVAGLDLPVTTADKLFESGYLDAQHRDYLNQGINNNGVPMTIADYFNEQAALLGEEAGKQQALRVLAVMERQRLGIVKRERTNLGQKIAGGAWDAFKAGSLVTKEAVQFNIITGGRGVIGDIVSDSYTLTITGHPMAGFHQFDRSLMAETFRSIQGKSDPALLNNLEVAGLLRESGESIPTELLPRTPREMHGPAGARADVPTAGEMTLQKGVMKLTGDRGQRVSGTVLGVFANRTIRDFRSTMDSNRRISLFLDQYRTSLTDAAGVWEGLVRRKALREGWNADEAMTNVFESARNRAAQNGVEWNGSFDNVDVLNATGKTDLARAWKHQTSIAKKEAKAEVDRILFSYKHTAADKALSHVFFFHYWQSRALALHARTTLHNPWLLAAYWRTWKAIEQNAEEEGYPDNLKGYIRFMGDSTQGYYSLFNPLGIVVPFMMFSDLGGDQEGAPWEKVGLFINPWVEGGLAAFGLTENVPDVTGSWSVRNAVKSVLDYGNAHGLDFLPGGDTPSGDFVRNIEARVFKQANDVLRSIGLPAGSFGPYDPRVSQIVQIKDLIETRATDLYGPRDTWTPEEAATVTDAKVRAETDTNGNPLSEWAWDEYTKAGLINRGVAATVPGGVRQVNADLTRRREGSGRAHDAWKAEQTPTTADANAADAMAETNAGSPQATTLITETSQYHDIGTDRQKGFADGFNTIAYGTNLPAGFYTIGGVKYFTWDLMAMPTEARRVIADAWVKQYNGTAEFKTYQDQRKSFISAHPEYQGYDTYEGGVRNYPNGGVRGFRKQAEQDHPEFADQLAQKRDALKKDGKKGAVLENELDDWTVGLKGYNAFRGIRDSIYDETPKPAYDPTADPYGGSWAAMTGDGGGSGFGGGDGGHASKVESLKSNLVTYQTKMDLLAQKIGGDPTRINPYQRQAMENLGEIPQPPSKVADYLEWSINQAPGTDTSVDAYVTYLETQEAAA